MTARKAVFTALLRMYRDSSFSNLALDGVLKETSLPPRERQFSSALFYGILERKLTLDYAIESYSKKPAARLDTEVIAALEMGLYQLAFMNSVPDSAAVNESVNLIKTTAKRGASGFVNGILRNFIRNGKELPLPSEKEKYARAEVKYSISQWILKRWEVDHSWEWALNTARASLGRPELALRVNTRKTTLSKAKKALEEEGVAAREWEVLPDCIFVENSGRIPSLAAYRQGLVYVQDVSSQLCAMALGVKPGERVFDMCSAPGSKSFTIAQLMEDKGELLSFDLYPKRVGLIREGADRLGLCCIHPKTGDSAVYDPTLGLADKILCDVPCSGLGVIRRKPEIKYKKEEEANALPPLQREILANASRYLKPGGILVYSTCALNRAENEENIRWFLSSHEDFALCGLPEVFSPFSGGEAGEVTLSPCLGPMDGFYIARMRKKEEGEGYGKG